MAPSDGESLQSEQPKPELLESRQPEVDGILEESVKARDSLLTPEQKAGFKKMREAVDKKDRLLQQIYGMADKLNAVGKGQVSVDKSKLRNTIDTLFYRLPSVEAKLTMVQAMTKAMEIARDASVGMPTDIQGIKEKIEELQRKISNELQPFEQKLTLLGLDIETVENILGGAIVLAVLALAIIGGLGAAFTSGPSTAVMFSVLGGSLAVIALSFGVHSYIQRKLRKDLGGSLPEFNEKKLKLYQSNKDAFLYDVINEFVPDLTADQFQEVSEAMQEGKTKGVDFDALVNMLRRQLTQKMADGTVTWEEFHQSVSYLKSLIEVRP